MTDRATLVSLMSRDLFTRRIVVPMATMGVVAIALVLSFVIVSARSQNQLEVESSTKLADTALSVNKRQIARTLRDYAVWEDAYHNLHVELDFAWASTDGNVGANIFEGLGYDMAFVVRPTGDTVYSVIDGVPQRSDAADFIPSGLDDLIASAVRVPMPEVGLLRSGDDILMVAATAILPPSVDTTTLPISDRSTLIFAKKLDESVLARMSSEYLLNDLAIVPAEAPASGPSLPLLDPDGESLGRLTWSPERPGYELLRLLLPPLSLSIVVFAAFTALVIRNARRSAMALEDAARTVEAYAQTLQDSEARFRDVAEASSDWIWECDPDLRLVYFSTRFSEATGIAAASVLGKTLGQFFSRDAESDGLTQPLTLPGEWTSFRDVRCCYRDVAGHVRICRLAGRPILDHDGAFMGYRGTATDITEEVEAQARASHLSLHDALTGLPNRVLFAERLNLALQGAREDAGLVSVLCLDLDKFKEVNDTLGHAAGDLLLQVFAERLQSCVRPGDTVARLGGDEFAVIQHGVREPAQAEALSHRIIDAAQEPFTLDGQEVYVGVSVGVALPEGPMDDPKRLLKNADIALYRAKQAGRGVVRFFEAQMDLELQARKALENDLRQALLRNELEVHYQPVINLDGHSVAAIEALVRWRHPSRGAIPPDIFIPIAEETGLIASLGEWVLRTACAQARAWPDVQIAVNLSPTQFRHRELVDTVREILAEMRLEPSRLELEITESVLINDTETALGILTALKDLGVRIAMDDFGSGYSSLRYLNLFSFDKIKIDRSFISSGTDADKSNAIVRSVISLGHALGIVTTAEGVETSDQLAFLRDEGCAQAQGYLFGPPMSATEMSAFLTQWAGTEILETSLAAA